MRDSFNMQTLITATFAMGFVIHGFNIFIQDCRANWVAYRADLLQPWKLVTLAIGLGLLLIGSSIYRFSDWDAGVSIIMAASTYMAAPWCARAVFYREWRKLAGVMVLCWFAVDGSYTLWHNLVGNAAMREANFPASAALFWLCGFLWLPRGSLGEIISSRSPHHESPRPHQ